MERTSVLMYGAEGPVCLAVNVRESQSAPNRLKVAFTAEFPEDARIIAPDGSEHRPPEALVGQQLMFGSEFRLELN